MKPLEIVASELVERRLWSAALATRPPTAAVVAPLGSPLCKSAASSFSKNRRAILALSSGVMGGSSTQLTRSPLAQRQERLGQRDLLLALGFGRSGALGGVGRMVVLVLLSGHGKSSWL
jgi:hypothetical protein